MVSQLRMSHVIRCSGHSSNVAGTSSVMSWTDASWTRPRRQSSKTASLIWRFPPR
ncbi:hypothetical protein ACFFX0_20525 [Citricoccus parietis]|uniref:Uncharacterized protein n=1 Tax=Citricoccus parietis TaxID=592307 RepID=A0ABV5G3E6_9MICC